VSKTTIGVFLAVLAVGAMVAFVDFGEVRDVVRAADLLWMWFAIGVCAVSYALVGASYSWVFSQMGIQVGTRRMMLIGYTSAALNQLMPLGAVAGHGIRVALMRDHDVAPGDTLAASAFHAYVATFVLLLFLPLGLVLIVLTDGLPDPARYPLLVIAALTIGGMAAVSWLLFHGGSRRALIGRLGRIFGRFASAEGVGRNIEAFHGTIGKGIELFRRRHAALSVVILIDAAGWILAIVTLYACFRAFGVVVPVGALLTGFVVGVVVGHQAVIPGGIGLLEASMAGIFALLGVPFTAAVLVAILFRVVYHVLPFGVALFTYGRIMQRPLRLGELRTGADDA
jgi:glycosyltransferase 2 family protein